MATHRARPDVMTTGTAMVETGVTIGDLAGQTGVTVETVRYYERVGILPRATRTSTGSTHAGYRRYMPLDVERLRFVKRARDLGFSLDEVRDLMGLAASDPGRPCGEVDALARAHLAQVEEKIAQLGALRDELRQVIDGCGGGIGIGECQILGALSRPDHSTPTRDKRLA